MNEIFSFLSNDAQLPLTLFLCIGLGYLVGYVKIKSFSIGATVGTLLIGLLISQLGVFKIPDLIKALFFALFSFTIGYEAGPVFFANLRSSGVKLVALTVFYCACVLVISTSVCKLFGFDIGTSIGLVAGAQTQTAILGVLPLTESMEANATVGYALTYTFGTLGAIAFVKYLAPKLLRQPLYDATKAKIDMIGYQVKRDDNTYASTIQMRAFIVEEGSNCIGQSIDALESRFENAMQFVNVFRDECAIEMSQDTKILARDVIVVIGNVRLLIHFDDASLTESSDEKYMSWQLSSTEVVITKSEPGNVAKLLSEFGILLQRITRNGRELDIAQSPAIHRGDMIRITGSVRALKSVAVQLGYVKDTGIATDIPFLGIMVAVGLALGALAIHFGNVAISLGASGGVMVIGLLCGWHYNRRPRFCRIPESVRWFLKSVGLNLYIAALALNAGNKIQTAFQSNGLWIILASVFITMLPHIITLYFGKHALKLDTVDLLGGQCGCGTCTAALNALTEDTGSSIYATSYAPAYAVGNILLTVTGMVIAMFLQ